MSHRLCKGRAFVAWSRLDLEREVERLRAKVKRLQAEVAAKAAERSG